MDTSDPSIVIGSVGVSLLLIAFVLNASGRIPISRQYTMMNLVGAGLAAYASYLIEFLPFFILELVWCIAASVKLITLMGQSNEATTPNTER